MGQNLFHSHINKPIRRKSLATQLTWVSILMVTLALVAVGTGLIFIAHRTQQDSAFRLQQQSAEQVSQLISGYMTRAVDRLVFFLESTSLSSQSPEQQRTALGNLLITSLPLYSQVTILDKEGNELSKISRFHTFLPDELINQAQSPAFLTAIKGDNYMGPVAFLENTGLLSVSIALPIKSRIAEITGVLIAEVNASHLWQKVARIKVGQSGYAYLVDMKGRFVAYQKPAEVLQKYGEDMSRMPPVSEFIIRGQDGTGQVQEYQGLVNEEVIGVYAPIEGTNWAVLVEQPTREAYASISEMQRYLLGLMFLCIILAGGLGYYVSRRLIGPIRTLTDAAQRFGTGDLETKFIHVQRQDEVGVLSHAFNKMQKELHDLYAGLKGKIEELEIMHKALQESEEKYRTILESIEDGYYEVDIDGNFTFFNDALCEIYGSPENELMGINIRKSTDQETAKRGYKVFKKVNISGRPEKGFDWEIIRKDGMKRVVEASVSLRRNVKGEPVGFRGIVRDISEKQKLEAHLQKARKMEAIGMLAGGVAHDLNNILGGLVSYPELLLLQLPENSPLRKSILTIQRSGEKAAAVVQDLLTLARRGVVVTEVVDLNDVIYEYLRSPEYEKLQSYHPGVHIEAHLEKENLNILGSSTHLSKTVMNLVSNAAEAMSEGGTLTVSTENRYIDRPVRGYDDIKEGDYLVLTVSDTGTGIASDDMEKIFEPFYTKKKMGRSGTGLGMAVVWGTVKDHNGYIDVKSTEGKGTTFTLYFPVTRKSVEEKFEISLKDYMGKGEAILVVDDVEEQRKIASGMLEELGYSVVSVSSGEEAVEYLKTHKVDLLVLDMIMDPGMDGLGTYRKILEIHPGQKAIISSGFSETGRAKELQGLGAGAYIKKPFLLEKIGVAVKKELEKTEP